MATMTITIPDALVSRVNNAFAAHFSMAASSANTKAQMIEFAKMVLKAEEGKAAKAAAENAVESEIALT